MMFSESSCVVPPAPHLSRSAVSPVALVLVALLAAAVPDVTAFAQEIPTERVDPQAEYPVGGVVASVEGGGFVAAWSRGGRLTFGVDQVVPGIPVAAWFSSTGERTTPVREIREGGEEVTEPVAIASARAGEAVVVLRAYLREGTIVGARRVTADGDLGPFHPIETCRSAATFDLAVRSPGQLVLLCGDRTLTLSADGLPLSSVTILAPPETGPAHARGATAPDDGDLWVVWTQEASDGRRAFLRRFRSDGTPETSPHRFARVASTRGFPPIDVAALPGGGAVVAWVGEQGVAHFRLIHPDGTFATPAPGLLGPVGDGPASVPRVAASRSTVVFAWREATGPDPLGGTGYLRLVPIGTGATGDLITVDHGFAGSLAFDVRDRLAVLSLEPRPLDYLTYLSPRLGVAPLAALIPPPGDGVVADAFPGFRFWVRIGGDEPDPRTGTLEPLCQPETACFSGSLPGRSEVEVRIVGPKPNGYLWPNVVRFTTSQVEVWIEQLATGERRYYLLDGVDPGSNELDGLFDRVGFLPR